MSRSSQPDTARERRGGGREGLSGSGGREGLRAFGLSLSTATPPPGAWAPHPWAEPGLELQLVEHDAIAAHWSGLASIGWQASIDGAPFLVERGCAGDHRFVHGEHSVCHLTSDGTRLRCALRDGRDLASWRVILDSVLFSVALLRGYEALHAGAVATPAGAVAIAAGAGGGKSTLLAELLDRGQTLLADDVLVLEPAHAQSTGGRSAQATQPLAHPGAPLMTVPVQAPQQHLGPVIASIGDERWVAVPTHEQAIPLAALVLLERRPGLSTELLPVRTPLVPLLRSLLAFPQTPQRERARFELASVLASQSPVWRLTADPAVAPQTLGELILAELPALTRAASLR